MTNINRINLGVNSNNFFKKEENESLQKEQQNNVLKEKETKQVSSGEMLSMMAAVNADIIPAKVTRTVDVSKYVNEEQAARIAGFMQGFDADFEALSSSAMAEFPDLSQGAADSIALKYINETY